MDLETLLNYYADRLPAIYRNKTNARAQTKLFVKQALADTLASQVSNAFSVDTATGQQLDWIGKYIGLSRNIAPVSTPPYFQMGDYNGLAIDYPHGFTSYDGTGDWAGIFASYLDQGQSLADLPDNSYRQVLKLKIFNNSMDGTTYAIQQFLTLWFPNQIQVVDDGTMHLTYLVDDLFSLPPCDAGGTEAILVKYLPRPMGVGISVTRANLANPDFRVLAGGTDNRSLEDGALRILAS